jgi:hypothetical protein
MERLCFGSDADIDNEIDTDGKKPAKSFAASVRDKFRKVLLLLSLLVTLLAAFVGGSVTALFQVDDAT